MPRITILVALFGLALLVTRTSASAQEAKRAAKAPALLDRGVLNKAAPQFEQIFQFTFDGPRLKLDRRSWGDPPKKPPKLVINSFNSGPPIESIFNQIRADAGRVNSSGMSVSNRHREINFSGGALNGRLRTSGDQVRMELEEVESPQRMLEWSDDGQGSMRLMISNQDDDLLLLQQTKQGTFRMAGFIGGKSITAHGDNFLAMYRQERLLMDSHVLPVLQALSIRLIPSPSAPAMKKAVLALLARTPATLADGKKLLADLDSEKFAIRDKASKALNERFEIYKDIIQERLKDSSISQEAAARLQKIMALHPDAPKVSQTIAALDLLRDPVYLVGLLDEAPPPERAKVVEQLTLVTGQRLGDDAAAWKRWLAQKKP
ncbi:MAG: hypothetical protein L0Y71_22035 [Gemmataceae bacterium]|nr:hypothetical protein [Gemmataceae bacterium]